MAKNVFGDETQDAQVNAFGDPVEVGVAVAVLPEPAKEPLSEDVSFDRAGKVWDAAIENDVPLQVAQEWFYDAVVISSDPSSFAEPIPDNRTGFSENFKREWTGVKGITKVPIVGGTIGTEINKATMWAANRLRDEEFDYDAYNFRQKILEVQTSSGIRSLQGVDRSVSKEGDQKLIAQAYKDFEFQLRGKTFGGKVAVGISQLPTWMIEFAATGGLASLGDDVARVAGEKLLRGYAKTAAGKFAIGTGKLATGAVIRTSTGLLPRVTEKATARQALIDIGLAGEESWATSLAKAWGDVAIESFSEETGKVFSLSVLRKLPFGGKFIASLQDEWIKLFGGTAENFATRMLAKGGYSTIIGELGEERLATLLREATGVSDRRGNPFQRIWEGMKEDFTPENLGAEIVTLLAPASVRRGMTMGVSLTKGVSVPTEAEQLNQAIDAGPIRFDSPEDAQGYADKAKQVADREDEDVTITVEPSDNTVTVEKVVEEPVEAPAAAPVQKPAPAAQPEGVEGAKVQEAAKEVEPKSQNFTQFATSQGASSDFDITDHSLLSPSGTISKRAKGQALERLLKRIEGNAQAHKDFEAAILAGTIVDSEGKITKQSLEDEQKQRDQKKIDSRVSQIDTQIRNLENVGIGKKGTLRPSFQKEIDGLEIEKAELLLPTEAKAPAKPKTVAAKKPKRLISQEAFDAARKRFTDSTKLRTGLDPQQLVDAAIVGGFVFESGVRNFADWSKRMVAELGDRIKPHLQSIFDQVSKAEPTPKKPEVEKAKKKPTKPRVTPAQKKAEAETRERGFISSIKTALPELKVEGTYIPRSTDELSIKAKNLVEDDIQKAENLALKGDSDKSVATASELLKYYNEQALLASDQTAKDAFYDKAARIANDIAAKLTEAGRTVQAAIILSRLTPEGQVRFAAREIQRHNEKIEKTKGGLFGLRKKIPELTPEQTKKILEEMKAIEAMPPGEGKAKRFQKLQNFITDLVPTPLFKKLITIWKAGLLTGIKTSGLNIMSTTSNVIAERIAKIPATMIDKVISLGTGKRTVTVSIKGIKQGTVQGVKRGFDYLTTGYDERNIGVKLDYKRVNMGKGKIWRALQFGTDGVFRLLGAEDQPFYYAAKLMSLFEQAKVAAINEGLKGKEAQAFIDNLMQDPTETMVKNASKDAEAAVFQNKTALSDLAKGIQGLGKGAGEIVVPFGRTPSAVAMQIINYSPAGAVKTIIENIGKGKFNQRDFVTGLGRSIVGAIPLVIGAALWEEDMITLDFPKTQKERDLWKIEGRKANSIKVDGKWRTVQSFGPAGNLLIVGGHFRRAFQESGSPSEAMAQAIFGSGKSFTEQTFLQGINQFTAALNDPERSGPRLARGLVSSVIPTIIGDVARAADPLERRTGTVGGRVKAKIPGLRQSLEPQITVLGEERKATSNPLEIMIDPTRPSKDISTPLVKELRRLTDAGFDVTPSQLGNRDGYDILTPAENTKLWRRAGELTRKVLEEWVTSEGYKNIDNDFIKSKSIDALTTRMQAAAKAEVVAIKLSQGTSVIELAESGLLSVEGLDALQFFTE